ncbi:MAG: tRNA preQ1(34) S-adenosylmethionine ribosyltransferase-isomerase QueA [Elusimicrobiota bacterium]
MNIEHALSAYDFDLPKELIAQLPAEKRENSRLMVLDRGSGKTEHRSFADIAGYFGPGDCLVLNKTKVIPARLFGKKETGGRIEALFLKQMNGTCWTALVRPFLGTGKSIIFPDGLSARVSGKTELGETILDVSGADVRNVLEEHGRMPLPPYIKRGLVPGEKDKIDRERYQTVYAENEGSIAAPTAGLHFTKELLERIKEKGTEIVEVTLHVGWGTFRPIVSDDIAKHKMLPEIYEIWERAASGIAAAKRNKGRVVVVGTTAARALESCPERIFAEPAREIMGETGIFIYPGYKFAVVDAFITNFHLPKSTPLMMACAFAGKEALFKAYEEAIREKYRFFSYGDAMFIK